MSPDDLHRQLACRQRSRVVQPLVKPSYQAVNCVGLAAIKYSCRVGRYHLGSWTALAVTNFNFPDVVPSTVVRIISANPKLKRVRCWRRWRKGAVAILEQQTSRLLGNIFRRVGAGPSDSPDSRTSERDTQLRFTARGRKTLRKPSNNSIFHVGLLFIL